MTAPWGVDLSSNNVGVTTPAEAEALALAGASFAIVKITEGTSYVNPVAAQQLAIATAAGLKVAGYLFVTAGIPLADQQDWYHAHVPAGYESMGVMYDFETQTDAQPSGLGLISYGSQEALYGSLSAVQAMKGWPWGAAGVVAAYAPTDTSPPNVGEAAWQWTDTGAIAGVTGPLDFDVVTDPARWAAFLGETAPVTVTDPSGDLSKAWPQGKAFGFPAVTPSGTIDPGGYYEVTQDGAVFAFGSAVYHGGANTLPNLAAPISSGFAVPGGYVLIGEDGGVYCYGAAVFMGSLPGLRQQGKVQ